MKRIIVFSYDFPPNSGGISRLTENITKFLAAGNSDGKNIIEVLTLANECRKLPPGVRVKVVAPSLRGRLWEAYRYLSAIKDKENLIVICGLWWPEGLVAEAAGVKNVYILTHAAEIRPDTTWFRRKIWIPLIASAVLKRAKKVVANSDFTARLSSELSPKAIVCCLPLAVNHKIFQPNASTRANDGKLHIVTVTRIHMWKGLDTILNAICQLPDQLRDKIHWTVAGKGPDLDKFARMVKASPIYGQVDILGFVPDEDLPGLYAAADLFVLCTRADSKSSNIEGFGLVFLESQSCGTPVVGTYFGGIPSAVEAGNGGWLVNDEKELCILFSHLIENPSEVARQGQNARKRVLERCTWETYIDKLSEIIGL